MLKCLHLGSSTGQCAVLSDMPVSTFDWDTPLPAPDTISRESEDHKLYGSDLLINYGCGSQKMYLTVDH